ncbi:hypothetical protein [Streptomyces sp. BPSDS2]|uniref:hypothetical protein n=1 Tax=Streptomyces sp. BPSDS2 TaxID=2571021 RepID=UPI0010C1B821|nr:hypothetical protein [Streptomyces sp. BPSDS2]
MKLTAPQTGALHLIHETPGRVAARVNGSSGCWIGFRTLHHRTEARLVELRLVETAPAPVITQDGNKVPVLRLTAAGYEALGIKAPAAEEEEVLVPLPEGFLAAYEAELAEAHADADNAPFRQVRQHVNSGRATAPRWLLGHLADVAALLADLVEEPSEHTDTHAAHSRGVAELLDLLAQHGARPWPIVGHGLRPWAEKAPHCEDCADWAGHRAPAVVLAAETAVDEERAVRQAAYEARLAAELRRTEDEIAAEHGEHMRPGAAVQWTNPRNAETAYGVVQSVYRRHNGKVAADVEFLGRPAGSIDAEQLAPITGRCGTALPTDPTPCDGAPSVTVLDSSNAGADGCERHGARLLAALDGGRVYALPDAPEGAALRVHRSAGTGRPAVRVANLRELVTAPARRPFPRFKLEPGWVDVDVPGWELRGDTESGDYLSDCHETFRPDDDTADTEAAIAWAEQLIGAPQDWTHVRERGFDRWEAGTRD